MKFDKGCEHTFSNEIVRAVQVTYGTPEPDCERSHSHDIPVEGQFYNCEPVKVEAS
jgi:hypothetical protein